MMKKDYKIYYYNKLMKTLKQTDRDYIYDNLIDVQWIVDDLVERMWEDEDDEDARKKEQKNEAFAFIVWFVLWILMTFGILALINMYSQL